uniref:Uncharacterized protein n=1 Tax=Arundo donax TaxID=35708 RepID=A0A0A9APQ2_ARUDO
MENSQLSCCTTFWRRVVSEAVRTMLLT